MHRYSMHRYSIFGSRLLPLATSSTFSLEFLFPGSLLDYDVRQEQYMFLSHPQFTASSKSKEAITVITIARL